MAAPPPPNQGFGQPHPHQQQQPGPVRAAPPELTFEEKSILQECNSESFWYRSLPVGALMAASTHVAVARGLLRPNPRFGSASKVTLAAIVGYFIGKFTYADTCADKFLIQAPRSKIAEMVRARRGIPPLEKDESEVGPEYSGLGVPAAPGAESPAYGGYTGGQPADGYPPAVVPATSAASYDELRRRNREPAAGQYRAPPPGADIPPPPAYQQQPAPAYPPVPPPSLYIPPAGSSKSKNKYGDEGFE